MNGALFRQTWRAQRLKLAVVSGALVVWGFLMPLVYAKFGAQFRAIMESGMLPRAGRQVRRRRHFQPARLDRARPDPPDCHHSDVGLLGRLLRLGHRGRATEGHA